MDMRTVVLEFSVDGLPLHGKDNIFYADTDMEESDWNALSGDEKDRVAHVLFNEQVSYGWHRAPDGVEA